MGPPAAPASRTNRLSTASSTTGRSSAGLTRPASGRMSLSGPRVASRTEPARRPSADSGVGRDSGSQDEAGSSTESPKEDLPIALPQPRAPIAAKTKAMEGIAASATPPTKKTGTPTRTGPNAAANREIEDLKAKLKILEKKRIDDRDRLQQLETIKGERDKFEAIIQKLQQKYQPIQQENAELRKLQAEAEARFESIESMQSEHDSALELAALDREMAEETAEVLKVELEALRQKSEELELEVEILREENSEFNKGLSPEEKSSANWMQMERTNERLREALLRLRDITQAQEEELKDQVAGLEEELKELGAVKENCATAQEKLEQTESAVEDLRQQLDTALGAEDMIEDLTERNMSMSEQIEELKAVIDDLENLKELNDELEVNHVQNERELQEELEFRDSVIAEQVRRAAQQDEALDDKDYTLSRFRELVKTMQNDLEDMRASQSVTDGESEKLNDRSRAMMDLNMKLQMSAAKAQVKTIDLELRRLEAQEAEQHLQIVKLFLPETYKEDQDAVLALLRFKRLSFKSSLLNSFIKERLTSEVHAGHEDDIFAGCDAVDKLVWVSAMCDRFVNDISHCSVEQFARYQNALHELEPVERALNGWIDGLRRDDLKEAKCADELQRTIALMSHLAEVHISDTLPSHADDVHLKSLTIQSHLDSAATALSTIKDLVQRVVPSEGDEAELADHFAKKCDLVITQTRGSKVIAGKVVRALEELKTRSLSLPIETGSGFEETEAATQALADLTRRIGTALHALLTKDEARTEPFTYTEVQDTVHRAVLDASAINESDLFADYSSKLRVINGQIGELSALATDLDQAQEFDADPAPWQLRSQELRALKIVPVEAEEELRRLKEEHSLARRTIAQQEEQISTHILRIEFLDSRQKQFDSQKDEINQQKAEIEERKAAVASLRDDIQKQDRELKSLESERDKWKKIASDSRAFADGADAAGAKAGQERAVATAREMDALKKDIESLQSAVRYLREDSRRARVTEQQTHDWLTEPLKRPAPTTEQRRALVEAEGKDVLSELVRMATSGSMFDLASLPKDKLAWRPAKTTPQYHAARQTEDYEAWKSWQDSVVKKTGMLRRATPRMLRPELADPAARLQIRLPGADGKMLAGSGRDVQIVGSREWEALQGKATPVS